MKKSLRISSLVLVLVLALSVVITGCGGTANNTAGSTAATTAAQTTASTAASTTADPNKIDTSAPVTLKWVQIGGKDKDFDQVFGEINKVLKEKINATLDVSNVIGWGDIGTKIPLLFSSGDDFDMIYSAAWFQYGDQSAKGGYMEITPDMIKKYMPQTDAKLPKNAWTDTMVNGKIYMIPSNGTDCETKYFLVRGDLRQKYGLPEVTNLDNFAAFCDGILKNEKGLVPYADRDKNNTWDLQRVALDFPNHWMDITGGVNSLAWYDYKNPNAPLFMMYDKPEFLDYAKKMVEWKNKGYWSKSALTQETGNEELFKVGKSAITVSYLNSVNSIYGDWKTKHPDWKLEVYNANVDTVINRKSYTNDGISIHAGSKNWERALMAIDLLGYDKNLHDLLLYGIKGRNFDVDADGKRIDAPNQGDYGGGSSVWNFRNFDIFPDLVRADSQPQYIQLKQEQTSKLTPNPYASLTITSDTIKSECAAINTILDQYRPIIQLGFDPNPEKVINECKAKIKAAGSDKVMAEIQAQATAHLQALGK